MEQAGPVNYDPFAWLYEEYWSADISSDFLYALEKLFLPELEDGSSILDLCCGTGRITAEFARMGFTSTGLDSSASMLEYARKRAPAVEFIQADARSFEIAREFDGVISVFDSLNHMMTLDELLAVFQCTFRSLRPGGTFFFDMNLERGFRRHWEEDFSVVEPEYVAVVHGNFDRFSKIGRYDFTLFRAAGGCWNRNDFTILQRCYTRQQITSRLRGAGFTNVRVFDAAKDAQLPEHTGRIFVSARRP